MTALLSLNKLNDYQQKLANDGFAELKRSLADRKLSPNEFFRLIGMCAEITEKMDLTGKQKKDVLVEIVSKYIKELDVDEQKLLIPLIVTLDVGVDVLCEYKKGKFKGKNKCNKFCLFLSTCIWSLRH